MFNKRAFKDRVDLERRVLSLVNGSKISHMELAGLSTPALNKWIDSLSEEPNFQGNISHIRGLMMEISERLRLNSDKSRDVFENDELIPKNTIEMCLVELEDALV